MRHTTFLFSALPLISLAAMMACSSGLDLGKTGGAADPAAQKSPGATGVPDGTPRPATPCPAADGTEALLATEPARSIMGLTVDGDDVYYAATPEGLSAESVLRRVPLSGGDPVELGRTPGAMTIVVSGAHLYVATAGNGSYELLRVKKTGGAVETLALDPDEAPTHVVADGSGGVVYAGLRVNGNVAPLVRVAADGTRTKLGTSMPANILAEEIVATAGAILWTQSPVTATGNGDGAIYATSADGATDETLYGPDPGKPVYGLTTDATYMYFARSGEIARAPKAGGAAVSFAPDPGNPITIAADATHLYFLTSGTYDAPSNRMKHARVGRIPTATTGGAAETLRTELTLPAQLALGRCDVVYSTWDDGKSTVHRRAK
jgi:hypothetical protein